MMTRSDVIVVGWMVLSAIVSRGSVADAQELPPPAEPGWRSYVGETERQSAEEIERSDAFLALDIYQDLDEARECRERLDDGEVCTVEFVTLRAGRFPITVDDALVHHWYGSIRVPGATLNDVLAFVKDYAAYPRYYDEIEDVAVLDAGNDFVRAALRITRTAVLTVHYNMVQEATFTTHSPTRASARIIATRIREIDNAGEPDEAEKPFGEDQGFLWALNAYWKYEEVGDGVVLEAEIVSLSREIPWGLAWAVGPFVDSLPRESLETTLRGIRDGLTRVR